MSNQEKTGLEFIQDLERRHEAVLVELESLNARIEQTLQEYASSRKPPQGKQSQPTHEGQLDEAGPATREAA